MLALSALGWGSKRISRELGCSRNTVREYVRQGGWRPMAGRDSVLQPHLAWLGERLRQHRGNADVVRQDLHLAARVLASAQPRLDHARDVHDQEILGLEQGDDVGKRAVVERSVGGIHVQQAAGGPRDGRMLRDQLGRKVVVELG